MVKGVKVADRRFFVCEECGLGYETPSLAADCEEHCRTHLACSLEIARQAVYVPRDL